MYYNLHVRVCNIELYAACTCMRECLYCKTKHCHYTVHGLVFPFDGTAPISVVVPVARHCSV